MSHVSCQAADVLFETRRTRMASLLLALFRPGEAKAATVKADSVKLAFGSRSTDICHGDIGAVEVKAGWLWAGIRLGHAGKAAALSGLSKSDARAFAGAVEQARVEWWRRRLVDKI